MRPHERDNWVTAIAAAIIILRWTWLAILLGLIGGLLAVMADWTPQGDPNPFMAPIVVLVAPGYLLAEGMAAFAVFSSGSTAPVVIGCVLFYAGAGLFLRWAWHQYRR